MVRNADQLWVLRKMIAVKIKQFLIMDCYSKIQYSCQKVKLLNLILCFSFRKVSPELLFYSILR